MRAFLKSYPQSSRAGRARYDILKILVDTYPKHRSDLDTEIKHRLKLAKDPQARIDAEDEIASMLAEAGTSGIELPRAEKLAKHAVDHLSEPVYDQATLAQYVKYKEPPPKPAELHKQFANTRAEALAILADVYLDEAKPALASPLVAEAYTLDPRIDDVNTMRGRLALLNHDDHLALQSFERAQLLGTLKASDRDTMVRIYRQSHDGSEAGFDAEMDRQYAEFSRRRLLRPNQQQLKAATPSCWSSSPAPPARPAWAAIWRSMVCWRLIRATRSLRSPSTSTSRSPTR